MLMMSVTATVTSPGLSGRKRGKIGLRQRPLFLLTVLQRFPLVKRGKRFVASKPQFGLEFHQRDGLSYVHSRNNPLPAMPPTE